MIQRLRIIAVLCIVALVWVLWPAAPQITNYPATGTDIIAFGDSLVAGVGATDEQNFISQLEKQIGVPIINMGVPGDTTADGVARLSDIDSYDPKVVIVLLGGNDVLQSVPIQQTKENLETVITYIQSQGAVVLLLGVRGGIFGDRTFSEMYKGLATTHGTAYVPDVLRGVFGQPALMADAVHPNEAGYSVVADRVLPELETVLD